MDHKTEAFECLERGMLAGAKMHFRHAIDDIWPWTNKKTEDKSAVLGELLRGYAEVLWRENLSEDALCQIGLSKALNCHIQSKVHSYMNTMKTIHAYIFFIMINYSILRFLATYYYYFIHFELRYLLCYIGGCRPVVVYFSSSRYQASAKLTAIYVRFAYWY